MCCSSRARLADVAQAADDNVTVTVEDAIRGEKLHLDYDMVVLATGMQPSLATDSLPLPLPLDEDGFVMGGEEAGIFAAGCARMPLDVMRTAQSGHGRRSQGGANGEREVGGMASKIGVYFDVQNIGGGPGCGSPGRTGPQQMERPHPCGESAAHAERGRRRSACRHRSQRP